MEAITYKLLDGYSDRVPASVRKTWQPPQAVKALLQFEPLADQEFTIEIGEGEVPDLNNIEGVVWHHLATRKALSAKWLGRHYHKVGRFLHSPQGNDEPFVATAADAAYLQTVVASLKEALDNEVTGIPFPIITFACSICGSLVGRNEEELNTGKKAVCLQPDCGAEFLASRDENGQFQMRLLHRLPPCTSCGTGLPLRPNRLAPGVELLCKECGKTHEVVGQNWTYRAK